MVIAALVIAAASGVVLLPPAEQEEQVQGTFLELVQTRRRVLSSYLANVEQDLRIQTTSSRVAEAMRAFDVGYRQLGKGAGDRLRQVYGAVDPRDSVFGGSEYAGVHAKYHRAFTTYVRMHGYADALLLDAVGNVVYSVAKGAEFATNAVSGPWKDTDFGAAFRAAKPETRPGSRVFFDFNAYPPGDGAPTAIMAAPILGDNGETVGVFAILIPIESMYDTMYDIAGRTFMVGRCSEAVPRSVCAWKP